MVSRPIGMAGRRALDLARSRLSPEHRTRRAAPSLGSARPEPIRPVQLAAADLLPAETGQTLDGRGSRPPAGAAGVAGEAIKRETSAPSPEQIAERVYRLFCQELRRDRERRGIWR